MSKYSLTSPLFNKNPIPTKGCEVSIGGTFKNARRELGLTQQTFAACLNVDRFWLSKLENDRLEIDDETEAIVASLIPNLAEMLELDREWLAELPIVYKAAIASDAAFVCYVREVVS